MLLKLKRIEEALLSLLKENMDQILDTAKSTFVDKLPFEVLQRILSYTATFTEQQPFLYRFKLFQQ